MKNSETAFDATNSVHTGELQQDARYCDASTVLSDDLSSSEGLHPPKSRFAILSQPEALDICFVTRCLALVCAETKEFIRATIHICYAFATLSRLRFSQVVDSITSGKWGEFMADDPILSWQVPAQFSRGWPFNPQQHTLAGLLAEVEAAMQAELKEGESVWLTQSVPA